MKISLIKDTTSRTKLEKVMHVLESMFPDAEISAKTKFYASELGDYVFKLGEVYDKDTLELAKKVVEKTGIGVSDRVLNSLGE